MIRFNDNELTYSYCGLFITENEWIHPERTENTYEIICVREGVIYIEENHVEYTLNKGDLLILKPDIIHKGFKKSCGKTSFYWLHFNTDYIENWDIKQSILKRFSNFNIFNQLLHITNTKDFPLYSAEAMILTLLGEISFFCLNFLKEDSQLIRDAAEWIRINSGKKLSVEEISAKYGYNSEHFSRLFKKIFKTGLKKYICMARMNEAKNILVNSSYSIKQVAVLLNFDDENQFIQFFKYHEKKSPKKYRNSFFNTHMNIK